MNKVGLIHGPNLDRLGEREPAIYGCLSLGDLETQLALKAQSYGLELVCYQSNHEGALIDQLWQFKDAGVSYVIGNWGGFSHTSVALRDAILGTQLPCIEVHLTNIYARESFRQTTITAGACTGMIAGFGPTGYELALQIIHQHLSKPF